MSYQVSAQQMKDILVMVEGLNSFDNPDDDNRDVEGIVWGDGQRAVLGPNSIPVYSDYMGDPREVIGTLFRGDFGWTFTQAVVA